MKLMTWNPRNSMYRVPRQSGYSVFEGMDRMMDDFFNLPTLPNGDSTSCWSPRVDVWEEDKNYLVESDLPGLTREDISITMDENLLTISGERKRETEKSERKMYRRERLAGKFSRSLNFPGDLNAEAIKAVFKDGVLRISIPKTEVAEPRRIEIE